MGHGYKYIHIGLIQFGINPLVRPGLNNACLTCVLDTKHNKFKDALIGCFQSPLNNGPVWSLVVPRYQVSLIDPYINEFIQAYIQFHGYYTAPQSQITQLQSHVCIRFVSSSMPPLNPSLSQRDLKEGVIVGFGNITPLHVGFCNLSLPYEWNIQYTLMPQNIHNWSILPPNS